MNKIEFLNAIRERLKGYPRDEVDNSIEYYGEMIDDRIEDGMSEDAAVASLGDINDIVKSIKKNMPLRSVIRDKVTQAKEKVGSSGISVTTIIALILLFPFWFPVATIVFTLYMVFFLLTWVFDLVLFIVGAAGIVASIYFIITAITSLVSLNPLAGAGSLGLAIMCIGAGILLTIFGIYTAKGIVHMFAGILKGIKGLILKDKKGE